MSSIVEYKGPWLEATAMAMGRMPGEPQEEMFVAASAVKALDDPFIAWRYRDSISLQEFLRCGLAKKPPEHSTLAKTRKRLSLETDGAVFGWVLERLRESGLLRGRTVAFNLSLLMSCRFGFATPRALQGLAMAAAALANASARGLAVILGRIGRIPGLWDHTAPLPVPQAARRTLKSHSSPVYRSCNRRTGKPSSSTDC